MGPGWPALGQSTWHAMHSGREHMKDYQADPPAEIAASAWKRGYLKPLELLLIAAWKPGQSVSHLTVNSEDEIKNRSEAAIYGIRAWKGRRVLGLTDQT